jgi:predicted methyltransferase
VTNKLSAKERNEAILLEAIKKWFKNGHGYGPSYRNLVDLSELPLGTIHKTCRFLREKGMIEFNDKIARSITLTKKGKK